MAFHKLIELDSWQERDSDNVEDSQKRVARNTPTSACKAYMTSAKTTVMA